MKSHSLLLQWSRFVVLTFSFVLITSLSFAQQWTNSGNDIRNTNSGNVRILTTLSLGVDENGPPFNQLFIKHNTPEIGFWESDQGFNEKYWIWLAQGKKFTLFSESDDFTSGQDAFSVNRGSGVNISSITFPNGVVGIGTTTPDLAYKLSVNGTIRAKEIKVNTGWSDFVFSPDYKLTPLDELENSIKLNRHLPDIPTAKEVEIDGVSLGEMQSKLLQKIEELTLYVIKLNKENEGLKNRIALLEKGDN